MKKILLAILVMALSAFMSSGQELSDNVRAVYDACVSLRTAAGSGSTSQMREANTVLKSVRTGYFGTLRQVSGEKVSLDGHFIFDYEFVDSLLVNRKVYAFAQKYANRSARRGTSTSGVVQMKTCCVKADGRVTFKFWANERQEVALVTEPGGMVNMKVYDSRNDLWHNDDEDTNTGKPFHVRTFDIPDGLTEIIVEVVNKTSDDVSFVIICN